MKEIIYLNTELMNSMIAQLNRGVITNFSQEQSSQETHTAGQQSSIAEKTGIKSELRIGTGVLPGGEIRIGGSGGNDGIESTNESQTFLEGEKDILNKQFHDHSLEILVSTLKQQELLKNTDSDFMEGDIFLGESTFDFYDFDLIRKSVNMEFMEELIMSDAKTRDISYEQAKKIVMKPGKLTAKEREKSEDAQYVYQAYENNKEVLNVFKILNTFSSYASELLSDLSAIKTDDKIGLLKNIYLRDSSESLSFRTDDSRKVKYLVRIIGRKNHIYNEFNMPESFTPSEIGKVPNIMLDILLGSMDIINKGDLLVSPIAIYYE